MCVKRSIGIAGRLKFHMREQQHRLRSICRQSIVKLGVSGFWTGILFLFNGPAFTPKCPNQAICG